ncbi:MauE/DoxX family redox-associated membrane protein [Microbacterium sp. LWH12-1.2]|uniref:MauE/DoxX family redox-associated membrane protein n=1 Tax=Microbacterium sp. LWH12-1.2 TaxID=3135259 RepID=UPI0034355012
MTSLLAVAPLILAGVLIASGIAKLFRPEDADAWGELGVPAVLRQRWLIRLHPWGEILLALALLFFGGVLGLLAAAGAVLLFGAYLFLVWRRWRMVDGASCNCFGARQPITGLTIVRNAWFLVLSILTAWVIGVTPLIGGPVITLGNDGGWVLALAASALTVALILWHPPQPSSPEAGVPIVGTPGTATEAEPEEYLRARTPAVPVTLADGRTVNLRDLAARGPILLLAVKEGCGSCVSVIAAVPRWRALLPEVSVRFLLWPAPEKSSLTELTEPQSLHDPHMYVQQSIADWATPAAVLIGADGYLAGGPVSGSDAVSSFIDDIYENLHGERPAHDS